MLAKLYFTKIFCKILKSKTSKNASNTVLKRSLPSDAILIGQSLNFDLNALQIMHPYVIDTSVIFNITGVPGQKTKLKTLSQMFLGEVIQDKGADGHDPKEDAIAAM